MANILVVDDELQICQLLKELLEMAGHTVYVANNGVDAEKLLNGIDLALVDIVMPMKSGDELIQDLIKIDPGLRVVVMSGCGGFSGSLDGEDDMKVYASWLNVVGVLKKPFTATELLNVVQDAMIEHAV